VISPLRRVIVGTGCDTKSLAAILTAVDDLHARGPRAVLVTSVRSDATPDDSLDVIASGAGGRHLTRTPLLATPANGAGDLTPALLFFHYLRSGDVAEALAGATSSVFGLLRRTRDAGSTETVLIEAQEELMALSQRLHI
jgi:pyridoxine kinase